MSEKISIERLNMAALNADYYQLWTDMRAQNLSLYSPYFHPEYSQFVGSLQGDAYVSIIRKGGDIVGFLPFQQRKKKSSARPIGAPMTDYHGIISARPLPFSMEEILTGSDISAFQMASQMNRPVHNDNEAVDEATCAVMNLSDFETIEDWRASRDSSYRRHLKSLRRRIKKTETEHGPRRFIWQSTSEDHFDQLIEWKKQKFSDTGKYDVLGVDWTLQLLKNLWRRGPNAPLRCDLHVMMINNQPAAMDLGLTDGITFHSWIVGYDNQFHSLSPGMQLLEMLINQMPNLGYQNIDLGSGLDGYKKHYASWPHMATNALWLGRGIGSNTAKLYSKIEHMGRDRLKDLPGKFRRRYTQISACDPSLSGQTRAMWHAIKNGG